MRRRRAIHQELLETEPRTAPEPESADELWKRVARPAGKVTVTAGAVGGFWLALHFVPDVVRNGWIGPLIFLVAGAIALWRRRDRIREWWENQP